MSGITPILDTLLHQVLGRRDTPADRPLPDNLIPPPRAGLPPQAAHSDSRLDPRPLPAARTVIGGGDRVGAEPASRAAPAATPEQGRAAVTTRFSAAARIIADVLARFPAAPAAIRASLPLVTTGERTQVAQLAARLRDSIESSGLFYEAHLLRWRGGTFPLTQLLREPQMLWGGRDATPQAPLPPPQQGTASTASPPLLPNPSSAAPVNAAVAGNPPSPPIASPGYGADGKPVASAHAESPAPGTSSGLSSWALTGSDQAAHPALEGVLRHQLEMLAAPVLRWEGAPWSGAFMALALQPPPLPPDQEEQSGSERRPREDAEAPWQTHLTLRLARLGEVAVNLQLGAQRVALDLQTGAAVADRMDAASGILRERIEALGFQSVALRIHARETSDGP